MKKLIVNIAFLLLLQTVAAQNSKYWISFADKGPEGSTQPAVSEHTLAQRARLGLPVWQATDLPVHPSYVAALAQLGINPINQSKWLNAITAHLSAEEAAALVQLPFVTGVEPVRQYRLASSGTFTTGQRTTSALDASGYHPALTQMNGEALREARLDGTGVVIGVIDGGFLEADKDEYLGHVFAGSRILDKRDYVNPSKENYFGDKESWLDWHGTKVMTMITGLKPDGEGQSQHGLATGASFYLARTDHGTREWLGEEDYWVAAIEWMDSLGIRLVNTSLGYSLGHDDHNEDYSPEQMNGKTSKITLAAEMAGKDKGILVVISAGNDGGNPDWRIISAPADAEHTLVVGATRERYNDKIGYSGVGPTWLPYVKPNVSCFSPNGTSFSCPAVCGLVACLMQADSTLTNAELIDIVQQSSHLYPYANNYLGYGVPNASKALALLDGKNDSTREVREVQATEKSFTLDLGNAATGNAVLFHKMEDGRTVIFQEGRRLRKGAGGLYLNAPSKAARTTVATDAQTIEVFWPEGSAGEETEAEADPASGEPEKANGEQGGKKKRRHRWKKKEGGE